MHSSRPSALLVLSTNLILHSLVTVVLVGVGIARGPLQDESKGLGLGYRAMRRRRCRRRARAFSDVAIAAVAVTLAFLSAGYTTPHSHKDKGLVPSPSLQHFQC